MTTLSTLTDSFALTTSGPALNVQTIAMMDGTYLTAYAVERIDGRFDILGQRFDNTGTAVGVETLLSDQPLQIPDNADFDIVAIASGGFAISFETTIDGATIPQAAVATQYAFGPSGLEFVDEVVVPSGNATGEILNTSVTAFGPDGLALVFLDRVDGNIETLRGGTTDSPFEDIGANTNGTAEVYSASLTDGRIVTIIDPEGDGTGRNDFRVVVIGADGVRDNRFTFALPDDGATFDFDVAATTGGGFVVGWTIETATGSFVQFTGFNDRGASITDVITMGGAGLRDPQIVTLADGSLVVLAIDTTADTVVAQRISSDGFPAGDIFVVQAGAATALDASLSADNDVVLSYVDNTGTIQVETLSAATITGDLFEGDAGDNTLTGTIGDDTLDGFEGDDTMFGSDGDDLFIGGAGADTMFGGSGFDTADYSGSASGISLKENSSGVLGGVNGDSTGDRLAGFEAILGTDFGDTLDLDLGNNSSPNSITEFYAGAGNDILSLRINFDDNNAANLSDFIFDGGEGRDTIRINGGGELDFRALNLSGWETIGFAGNTGSNLYLFDADQINDLDSIDMRRNSGAGSVETRIFMVDETELDISGFGTFGSNDSLLDFVITGDGDAETIIGGSRSDMIIANGGNDTLNGGNGLDTIFGGDGSDTIIPSAGEDESFGGAGADVFITSQGTGADTLGDFLSSIEEDVLDVRAHGLTAQEALDLLENSAVVDGVTLDFGAGDILTMLEVSTGNFGVENFTGAFSGTDGTGAGETINGTAGGEEINGLGGNDVINGLGGRDILNGNSGNDELIGGGGNDVLSGQANADDLFGGAGDDELFGGAGFDELVGSIGNDILNAGSGNDTATGGDGDDVMLGVAGSDSLFGGAGDDSILGGNGFDNIQGGEGSDRIDAGLGLDRVFGGAGDDVILGNAGSDSIVGGSGNDDLQGQGGNDNLSGAAGNDTLSGGVNNDTLNGGGDDDLLIGGLGADDFVFVGDFGDDTVADFLINVDQVDLTSIAEIGSFNDWLAASEQVGANVVTTIGANTITFENVVLTDFDANDFLLAI